MSFNLKIYFTIFFFLSYQFTDTRDFSKSLLTEYKKLIDTKNNSQISTSIACANLDILMLLMSNALNFDMVSMQKIYSNPKLYVNPDFYQNWKQNLIGQTSDAVLEKEIIKLEKLENVRLTDVNESLNQWKTLSKQTEEIIHEIGIANGYQLVLRQNTLLKPYSHQNLSEYSVVSKNIPNITLKVAKHILQSRGLTPNSISKILQSLEKNFIF